MSDTALDVAMFRMAQLEREVSAQRNLINDANAKLSKLETERANIVAWVEMWHQLAGTQGRPVAAERMVIKLPVENSVKRLRPKNPDRELVANVALEIIQQHGSPLNRRELFEKLAERGIIIQGKDPEMVLSTMLWRSGDKIVRLPPYGYWPKHMPFDQANYWPGLDDLMGSAANEPEDGIEVDDDDFGL